MVIWLYEPDGMLNKTTYVLKNRLHQESFLNQDSFLNRAFLNQECTVLKEYFYYYLVAERSESLRV